MICLIAATIWAYVLILKQFDKRLNEIPYMIIGSIPVGSTYVNYTTIGYGSAQTRIDGRSALGGFVTQFQSLCKNGTMSWRRKTISETDSKKDSHNNGFTLHKQFSL